MILHRVLFVQGGRRRVRQKKRWEDNITEWTGKRLREVLEEAEDREGWRRLVARASEVCINFLLLLLGYLPYQTITIPNLKILEVLKLWKGGL